jgi:HK97 family phage major capsid protein
MTLRELTADEANPLIGLSPKELKKYSLARAISAMVNHTKVGGIEQEVSDLIANKTSTPARGIHVPFDVAVQEFNRSNRALNVTTATAGGFTVGTETTTMIELLRANMVCSRLGARILPGLVGNLVLPRQTGGATAYWLDETSAVPASQASFGQLVLVPHRLAAFTAYTKQLFVQTDSVIESIVREDLMTVLAVEKDRAAINGLGAAGEPLGVLNTTGVNSLTFGGAPTWADAVNFETLVESDEVQLDGTAAYVTSPTAKGVWKTTEKSSSTGVYLWQDNTVNGYPALSTSQVPDNRMVFGKWSDLIIGDWGSFDICVDHYTLAASGQVRVIIQNLTDCGSRHAESFAVSTDSAAQ